VDFALTSVSGDTATGSVNAASNPDNDTVREPVTHSPGHRASVSGNNGVVLQVSMGTMRDWNFCNDTTHNYCGG
jgi:hypothetical protein